MPSVWRVLINQKLWDQPTFERLWTEGQTSFSQSKGCAVMRAVPQDGDEVLFVIKGQIRMKGIVKNPTGTWKTDTDHQIHQCNLGAMRLHATPMENVDIIIKQIGLSEPIVWKGQRTWVKMNA
jgi:hypothetical protein